MGDVVVLSVGWYGWKMCSQLKACVYDGYVNFLCKLEKKGEGAKWVAAKGLPEQTKDGYSQHTSTQSWFMLHITVFVILCLLITDEI